MLDLKDIRELFNRYFSKNSQVCCLINDILKILEQMPTSQPRNVSIQYFDIKICQTPLSKCKFINSILKEIILGHRNSKNQDLLHRKYLTQIILNQPEDLHQKYNDDLNKYRSIFERNLPMHDEEFYEWLSDMIYRILERARLLVSQLYFQPEAAVDNCWEKIFHHVNSKIDRLIELKRTNGDLKL
ncbi:hypothetical protein MXB_2911, partial [Myxobolus squamalis]